MMALILHSLINKNIPMDFRDKRADILKVHDQPWAFNGPYRVPQKDLVIFDILSGDFYFFYKNTLSYPSKQYRIHFWSLWYFTKVQGTLLDLNTQMDPGRFLLTLGEKRPSRALFLPAL